MIFACTLTSIRLGFKRGCSGVTVGAEEGPGLDIGADRRGEAARLLWPGVRDDGSQAELPTRSPKGVAWE